MQHYSWQFFYLFFFALSGYSQSAFCQKIPPAPDYSDQKYWVAHPEVEDWADYTPKASNFTNNQSTAVADVFYIHPTTALSLSTMRNARLDAKRFNKRTDFVILNQATVFNGSCRVFAPRYRQVSLITFLKKAKNKKRTATFNLAYEDIKAAFEYYLAYENNGRPIIIAGHSQGSYHGLRLLQDFFEGKPLYDQLVAAYLIGNAASIPHVKMQEFKDVKPAQGAKDTGCLVSWNSYKKKGKKYPYYVKNDIISLGNYGDEFIKSKNKDFVVINPLNWQTDSTQAPKELNIGATRFVRKPEKFEHIDKSLTDAQLVNGVLRISKPKAPKYKIPLSGDFHIFDYSLFYSNIRKNVADRLAAFLKQDKMVDEQIGGKN